MPQRGDASVALVLDKPIDLVATLAPLAHGTGDPTIALEPREARLAFRTSAGPAALAVRLGSRRESDLLRAEAWGPGARIAIESVPALVGMEDEPEKLIARDEVIHRLQRRLVGVRLPRSGRPFDALLPAILEQQVTGGEARRAYRMLVRRYGEPAPGPLGLWLAPSPVALAALPYHAFHPFGVERRRADVIRRASRLAPRLEGATADMVRRVLLSVRGIGPWTVAEVVRVSHGDPDAVSVGDYHLPSLVAWALAGEPRADDARMLELLEPYRGQRGRVQRLLELSGMWPPKYGPRAPERNIAAL
jgi:3-methyladenine DNA glycosylase/8-oxoguanine DNA glycosylase